MKFVVFVESNSTALVQHASFLAMTARYVSIESTAGTVVLTQISDGKVWSFFPHALSLDLDSTRLVQGAMSNVSTE